MLSYRSNSVEDYMIRKIDRSRERRIKIHVTDSDISHGRKNRCNTCPVARAINRFIDGTASVSKSQAELNNGGQRQLITLPFNAMDFIDDFDRGFPVHPFKFYLSIPVQFILSRSAA